MAHYLVGALGKACHAVLKQLQQSISVSDHRDLCSTRPVSSGSPWPSTSTGPLYLDSFALGYLHIHLISCLLHSSIRTYVQTCTYAISAFA